MRPGRLRQAGQGLALVVLLSLLSPAGLSPAGSATELEGAGALGMDLSFAPFLGRASAGTIVQRVRHPTSDQIRWVDTESSVAGTLDLGDGRRLVRLERFGRKADYELSAAVRGTDALVLDLRHNHGGVLRRMLRIAGRLTGPVAGAVRLVKPEQVRALAIPQPSAPVWRGRVTVLVGANTISSGEVLAALLRRYAGATVLGERTWGKDYALRVEPIDHDWRALIPDGRIEVPGEILAGGLIPDGSIPAGLLARIGDGVGLPNPSPSEHSKKNHAPRSASRALLNRSAD